MTDRLKIQKQDAAGILVLVRAGVSFLLWIFLVYLAFHFRTCTYLTRQAAGQAHILLEARAPDPRVKLSERAKRNLMLVPSIKKFSVDSLGYDGTANYEKIFYHGPEPVLWVVTASKPYSLEPVKWTFPVVGKVSYKGFFDKKLAALEFNSLRKSGFDAEVSPVTAYSTLGWFADPLFSSMLERTKPAFCNLLFHELFHATYYKSGDVNLNENLASFVAHKATLKFLAGDTAALAVYLRTHSDQQQLRHFLKRNADSLQSLYSYYAGSEHLPRLKHQFITAVSDSIALLPLNITTRGNARKKAIRASRNAYFVSYIQYESLQDSLENAFNKFYRQNIKNMVHDLKRG